MRYQCVRWLHDSPEYPTLLYSEIDSDGWEVRKVEEYADGRRDFASEGVQTGTTGLGEVQVPPLAEINSDPEFDGVEISPQDFDAVWRAAVDPS